MQQWRSQQSKHFKTMQKGLEIFSKELFVAMFCFLIKMSHNCKYLKLKTGRLYLTKPHNFLM